LREQLSPRGDVVSPEGRRKTEEVFGSPLTPQEVVERICRDVRERGVAAVLEYNLKLDRAELTAETLRVPPAELKRAHAEAKPEYLSALKQIRANILQFQSSILNRDVRLSGADYDLRQLYKPVRRAGVCVPGGAAAYPSTLLMTAVPAQAAGVREIAVMAPPTPFGAYNPDLLAACHELGVREVYRMGGAQAVAALAYGVDGVPQVDKLVGPGNLFVALAKQYVSAWVGIDMIAGPTEVVILADSSANPDFVAADLISQAEHAPGASILITWAPELVEPVLASIDKQLSLVDRGDLARQCLESYGAIITAADEATGCALSNEIAPEHLEVATEDPEATLAKIENAGAVFLGPHSPVAIGDYIAGPSHTLPTGGTARFMSPLSANTFLKATSVISYTPEKLRSVADPVRTIASVEGLTAHSHSVDVRFQND
jgi:histidinol dehydrogenase